MQMDLVLIRLGSIITIAQRLCLFRRRVATTSDIFPHLPERGSHETPSLTVIIIQAKYRRKFMAKYRRKSMGEGGGDTWLANVRNMSTVKTSWWLLNVQSR